MRFAFSISPIACHLVRPCAFAARVSASKRESPPSNSMIAARSAKASAQNSIMDHQPAGAVAAILFSDPADFADFSDFRMCMFFRHEPKCALDERHRVNSPLSLSTA